MPDVKFGKGPLLEKDNTVVAMVFMCQKAGRYAYAMKNSGGDLLPFYGWCNRASNVAEMLRCEYKDMGDAKAIACAGKDEDDGV